MIPVIDIDGYPTEETVDFLSTWQNFKDAKEAMQFALDVLRKFPYATVKMENNYIYVATGGWGGCEDIIRAMKDNIWIHQLLIASVTGGGYYFACPFIADLRPYNFKVKVTYEHGY